MRTHLIYIFFILLGIVAFRFSDLRLKRKIEHEQNENRGHQQRIYELDSELKSYRVIGQKLSLSDLVSLPIVYRKTKVSTELNSKSEYLLLLYIGDKSCGSCYMEEITILKKEYTNLIEKMDIACIVSPKMDAQYIKRLFPTQNVDFPVYIDIDERIANSLHCHDLVFTVLINKRLCTILMANIGRAEKRERTKAFYQKAKAIVGIYSYYIK